MGAVGRQTLVAKVYCTVCLGDLALNCTGQKSQGENPNQFLIPMFTNKMPSVGSKHE